MAIVAPELVAPAADLVSRVLISIVNSGGPALFGIFVAVVGTVLYTIAKSITVHTGAIVAAESTRIAGKTVRTGTLGASLVGTVSAVDETVAEGFAWYALAVLAAELKRTVRVDRCSVYLYRQFYALI